VGRAGLAPVRGAPRAARPLAKLLAERLVGTIVHYPVPPHLQPAYADLGYKEGDFPVAEAIHREVLSLPISPVMSTEQAAAVVAAVKDALAAL
jgi:dTDP-4-amino-4,6-dideoxygalactose transaminase